MKLEIFRQIKTLTQLLRAKGVTTLENYPVWINDHREIVWERYKNMAFALKDEHYDRIYEESYRITDFNFLLIDYAFVQFSYQFNRGGDIIKHTLAYCPCPKVEKYIESPADYYERYFGSTYFSETTGRKIIYFPIRFDFDKDTHTEFDHPISHLTLGNYPDCRIPLTSPLSPNRFISFILRAFYFPLYKERFSPEDFACSLPLPITISANEKKLLHLNFVVDLQSKKKKIKKKKIKIL